MNRGRNDEEYKCTLKALDGKPFLNLEETILQAIPPIWSAFTTFKDHHHFSRNMVFNVPYHYAEVSVVIEWIRAEIVGNTNDARWQEKLIEKNFDNIVPILLVAVRLQQTEIAEKVGKTIIEHLKGKSPAQVSSFFGILCDLTKEEITELLKEEEPFDLLNHS